MTNELDKPTILSESYVFEIESHCCMAYLLSNGWIRRTKWKIYCQNRLIWLLVSME